MAVSNIIMILQQQYDQHNPIKTRSTFIAIEEREEHHGGIVWIEQYEHIIFQLTTPGRKMKGEYLLNPPYAACLNFRRIKERG